LDYQIGSAILNLWNNSKFSHFPNTNNLKIGVPNGVQNKKSIWPPIYDGFLLNPP